MKKLLLISFLFAYMINYAQDHSEFITDPFNSPQEVTQTCLSCHETEAQEVMKTNHWTWLNEEFTDVKGETIKMGKKNFINNFCIAVPSNWPRCTSCHVGYGWKDESFDFSNEENVDCLICHDNSGTYKKVPTGAGMPDPSVDLLKAAQSVGKPTRKNCGICHFDGGGGTGVKHGDLDDSLYDPSPEIDVHMGGLGFTCNECHTATDHKIAGASHGSFASGDNHISCTNCHEGDVHTNKTINRHLNAVACETCHIPEFAREKATKTWWDWSKAGEDREEVKNEFGEHDYAKIKGEFKWEKNVVPVYSWSNGKAKYYTIGEIIDPSKPVKLNVLEGNISDSLSKIYPFKVMKGKQIFDKQNKYLIVPKLFGAGGYWKDFNWNKAAKLGMDTIGLAYSGSYDFIETEMYWPINHMVPSKDKALKCTSCHGKGSRMDWKALGYESDPMKSGGREKLGLLN